MHDEGRTIKGLETIRTWKKDRKARYRYRVKLLDLFHDGAVGAMRARLTDSFPGSPLDPAHTSVLAGGKIASLEIR
ncbi:hypothetical protein [Burkholderia sp. GS2Y]|uniref:Uncharacterized protein n=1 Tax=Burkholderia theae TaxID=3143496 RepID=A0ABU9WKN9_9BURK